MRPSDVSLHVSLRKQPCVLDPALILAHPQGPELAMRLTQVLEPWLTRSFWQVIDASELLPQRAVVDVECRTASLQLSPNAAALTAWIGLRDQTDAGSWPLRWVGDNLPESHIGDEASSGVLERYERLAQTLQERTESNVPSATPWRHGINPILVALDTVALSATLGGALILGTVATAHNAVPWPVQAMMLGGLCASRLDPADANSLFNTERQWIRHALVTAGVAVLAQRLPPLAITHVLTGEGVSEGRTIRPGDEPAPDPWANAGAWWYLL